MRPEDAVLAQRPLRLEGISLSGLWSFSPRRPLVLDRMARVNLVIGPNNVGKSNLCRAIRWLRRAAPVFGQDRGLVARARALPDPPFHNQDSTSVRIEVALNLGVLRITAPPSRGPAEVRDITWEVIGQQQEPSAEVFVGWFGASLFSSLDGDSENVDAMEASRARLADVWPAWQANSHKLRDRVERWLHLVLGEDIRLDIGRGGSAATLGIVLTRNGRPEVHTLSEVGAGVQATLILVTLRAALLSAAGGEDRGRIIVLDEPVVHLHPAAACELIRGWKEFFPDDQLIVTAHSTELLDAWESDWSVYHLAHDGNGTLAVRVATEHARSALLHDLGVRPSQLFLANVVIWVEGPSDAIYLRRLLRDSRLIDGRHYTFAFYGGASGRYLRVSEGLLSPSDQLPGQLLGVVELMRVSQHSIVVCDSDSEAATRHPGKRWVVRLIHEVRVTLDRDDIIHSTRVREIENLVEPAVLISAVNGLCRTAKRAGVGPNFDLDFAGCRVPEGKPFEESIAGSVRWPDGALLNSTERRTLKQRLTDAKTEIAEKVALSAFPPFRSTGAAAEFCDALVRAVEAFSRSSLASGPGER